MKRIASTILPAAALPPSARKRIETRILDYAEALGLGTRAFRLVSLDGAEPPSIEPRD